MRWFNCVTLSLCQINTQFMNTKVVRLMHYHVFLSSIQATLAASLPNKKAEIALYSCFTTVALQLLHYQTRKQK